MLHECKRPQTRRTHAKHQRLTTTLPNLAQTSRHFPIRHFFDRHTKTGDRFKSIGRINSTTTRSVRKIQTSRLRICHKKQKYTLPDGSDTALCPSALLRAFIARTRFAVSPLAELTDIYTCQLMHKHPLNPTHAYLINVLNRCRIASAADLRGCNFSRFALRASSAQSRNRHKTKSLSLSYKRSPAALIFGQSCVAGARCLTQ